MSDLGTQPPGFGWGGQMFAGGAYRDAAPGLYGKNNLLINFARSQSPVQEIVASRQQGVKNARVQDRNHQQLHAAMTKRAVNLVGTNLRLQAMPNYRALGLTAEWADEFAQAAENLFSLWGDDHRTLCDAHRHYQFGGLMFLAARNCYGADGETAIIIRYDESRMTKYSGRFATFIEVLDPDQIETPSHKNEGWQSDGSRIVSGRVLDQYGAYTALYVRPQHPGDTNGTPTWTLIQRETPYGRPIAVHWFPKHRAGMQRAMPAIIQSLRNAKMLDNFDDNQLKAAVLQTFLSMYIQSDATTAEMLAKLTAAPTSGTSSYEAQWDARFKLYDELNLSVEGQPLPVLAPGDKVNIVQGNAASQDTDSFRYAFERGMASNLHISYPEFSNDYSKTSFASIRAQLIDVWRMTNADRYMFTQHTASPIYVALLEEWIATGDLVLPPGAPDFFLNVTAYSQCEWRGPGMGWVDPVKDAQGAGMRMSAALSSPQSEAAAQGHDWRDTIDEIAIVQAYAKKRNVTLTWGSGSAAQVTGDAPEADGAGGGTEDPKNKSGSKDDGDGDGLVNEDEL